MRLSTDPEFDQEVALATIAAAVQAGITVFDTARSYGPGPGEPGHNERLLARAIRHSGAQDRARIISKGGMTRAGDAWIPDGRAKALRGDCEASLVALDGLPIDLYLLHAPDPRTPWRTSIRALGKLVEEGLVRRVGLANITRGQLDEALDLAPVAAVQVGLSLFDERARRGGVVERCADAGLVLIAHSPLGGPRRARRLAADPVLGGVAEAAGATPAEVALAWLLGISPTVVAIPGARRPETARSAARAARLNLASGAREALEARFVMPVLRPAQRRESRDDGEVVLVMGIPGAGKSRVANDYADRGYRRLNRDLRGGSLRQLADALDAELSAGTRRVVLDNTYLTRASRSYVVEVANRHRVPTRCVWIDTSLAQAQVNLVQRLLERFDHLPDPAELRPLSSSEPGLLMPTSQMRAVREFEAPSIDEGLGGVERVPFARTPLTQRSRGVLMAAGALRQPGWERLLQAADRGVSHLVFDWIPDGSPDALSREVAALGSLLTGTVDTRVCPHGAGPPTCWCRPPLPGLPLAFARARAVDLARSTLIGTGPAHRTLATTLGATYVGA